MLRGYQSFSSLSAVISSLSEGKLQATPPEKTTESILNFVENFGRAAEVEITSAFDLSQQEWASLLSEQSIQQKLHYLPAGNGGFWDLRIERGTCDPVTRTCAT